MNSPWDDLKTTHVLERRKFKQITVKSIIFCLRYSVLPSDTRLLDFVLTQSNTLVLSHLQYLKRWLGRKGTEIIFFIFTFTLLMKKSHTITDLFMFIWNLKRKWGTDFTSVYSIPKLRQVIGNACEVGSRFVMFLFAIQ